MNSISHEMEVRIHHGEDAILANYGNLAEHNYYIEYNHKDYFLFNAAIREIHQLSDDHCVIHRHHISIQRIKTSDLFYTISCN